MKAEKYTATLQPGDGIERYSYLEVRDYPRQAREPIRRALAETYLLEVEAGDILWIEGMIEVTNDLCYAVECGWKLIYSRSTGEVIGDAIISPELGYNVSPQVDPNGNTFHGMHHGVVPFSGSFVIKENATGRYVTLVVYAGGSSYTGIDDRLKVEERYGHMSVLRFRPNG